MAAGGADEPALDHLRLEEEAVQVAEGLGVRAQGLGRRGRGGEGWEAELCGGVSLMLSLPVCLSVYLSM